MMNSSRGPWLSEWTILWSFFRWPYCSESPLPISRLLLARVDGLHRSHVVEVVRGLHFLPPRPNKWTDEELCGKYLLPEMEGGSCSRGWSPICSLFQAGEGAGRRPPLLPSVSVTCLSWETHDSPVSCFQNLMISVAPIRSNREISLVEFDQMYCGLWDFSLCTGCIAAAGYLAPRCSQAGAWRGTGSVRPLLRFGIQMVLCSIINSAGTIV